MRRALMSAVASCVVLAIGTPRAENEAAACVSGSCNWVYIGTRASGPGRGILAARFDARSGGLSSIGRVAEITRPTWLLAHPSLPVIYSVTDGGNDVPSSVASFAADRGDGTLSVIDSVTSGGSGATHLAFDPRSPSLFVAHFGSGHVSSLPVASDGRSSMPVSIQRTFGAGPHRRQSSPHVHGVAVDPTHRFLLAADFSGDRVLVYRFNADTRRLTPASPPSLAVPPGSGPRHLAFHPDGRLLLLVTELSAEIVSFRWDGKRGRLHHVQTLALDEPTFRGQKSASHIAVSRDGRYAYAASRGTNSLVVYAVNANSGTLAEVQRVSSGGTTPWDFSIDPSGHWMLVANHGSNSLAVFAVDIATGKLEPTRQTLAVAEPSSVIFLSVAEPYQRRQP